MCSTSHQQNHESKCHALDIQIEGDTNLKIDNTQEETLKETGEIVEGRCTWNKTNSKINQEGRTLGDKCGHNHK